MASAIYPQAPGTEYGPCAEPCEHKDCQASRRDSQKVCRICLQKIGYERRTYMEYEYTDPSNQNKYHLVHATCLESEVEKERSNKRSFKIGDRVETLIDNNWLPGRIIGTASAALAYAWQVQMDDRQSFLSYVKVDRHQENVTMRHSDAPMPDRATTLSPLQKDSERFEDTPESPVEAAPVSLTDEPKFKAGDLVIYTMIAETSVLLRIARAGYMHSSRVSSWRYDTEHYDNDGLWHPSFNRYESELRPATDDEKRDHLTKEADRLDSLIERAMREHAAVVEQLTALTQPTSTPPQPSDLTPAEKGILAARRRSDLDMFGDPGLFVDEQGA